jgi:hypothetical protein
LKNIIPFRSREVDVEIVKLEKFENSYEEQMCSAITKELEKIPKSSEEEFPDLPDECTDLPPLMIKNEPISVDFHEKSDEDSRESELVKTETAVAKETTCNDQGGAVMEDFKLEPLVEMEPHVENVVRNRPGRRNKSNEARFRRKFEWGFYYEKYNIPKSSVDCIWEGCNYRGTNTYALEVHIRSTHEGIYDFKCLYCDKGFRLAYPCQRHELKCKFRPRSETIGENIGTESENDVKCPQCDQTFSNQLALNAHCKLLHGHNEMVLMAINDVRKNRGTRKRNDR